MTNTPVVEVIKFLVAEATSRSGEADLNSPKAFKAGVAIFDELDSLAYEEHADVYAVYLVGSGAEQSFPHALQQATAAGFLSIETMSQDLNLHVALSHGLEACRHYLQFRNASSESVNG